jgi:hypothetical protein
MSDQAQGASNTDHQRVSQEQTDLHEKLPENKELITRFKWKIHHYREFCGRQPYALKTSQAAPLTNNPNKKIALFFHRKKFFSTEKIGFLLMETDGEQTKFELKLWLEDQNGKKFGRREGWFLFGV